MAQVYSFIRLTMSFLHTGHKLVLAQASHTLWPHWKTISAGIFLHALQSACTEQENNHHCNPHDRFAMNINSSSD
jgi:hypothetical protein